jgi:hypothetical protein
MSRESFDQRVVEEFERELRDALAIEPSPDFARQVRARIAARRSPAVPWRFVLPIAAMCVLAVGLGMWMQVGSKQDSSKVASGFSRTSPPTPAAPTTSADRTFGTPRRTSTSLRVAVARENTIAPEPEIIVPPDRAEALERFLELTRNGALNEERLRPVAVAAPAATLEIKPLVVPPLSVPELETPSGAVQGGAERE